MQRLPLRRAPALARPATALIGALLVSGALTSCATGTPARPRWGATTPILGQPAVETATTTTTTADPTPRRPMASILDAPPQDTLPSGRGARTLHPEGANVLTGATWYGVPIRQRSIFWDGNGEVNDNGLGAHVLHYFLQSWAIGLGLNFAGWWVGGPDVFSAELEGKTRVHPIDALPVFIEGTAGYQYASDHIPPGGTLWNFSFGFGIGAEFQVAERTNFQLGTFYHHISNALGRENRRNPSQNEVRFWLGFAYTL